MKIALVAIVVFMITILICLMIWRQVDLRADRAEMSRLLALQPTQPKRFSRSMLEAIPEPAQRYFLFTIADGTPLYTVAEIQMTGQFSLGSQDAPNYIDMRLNGRV